MTLTDTPRIAAPGGLALPGPGTALLTDRYELTMAQAAFASGVGSRTATFEVFARSLPKGRRFGTFAGVARLLEAIEAFRFDPDELDWLLASDVIDAPLAEWLAQFRFCGTVDGYREGELYFPNSPVLTMTAPFAAGTLLETVTLSILNADTAVASAASRMRLAAGARELYESGSRRTNEQAAVAAARAAYIAGFNSTSNLAAARRYGIPAAGTSAHAFTLAHMALADPALAMEGREQQAERAAFRAQMLALGADTTLLVDTFDIAQGIRNAVEVANELGATGPGKIRIDSGDLGAEAHAARALLDSLGATSTRIAVSSDLDEFSIDRLSDAPVDAYGPGTAVVTGSGAPAAGFVYKLVAIAASDEEGAAMVPVQKRSASKASHPGRKLAWRLIDGDGFAHGERVVARQTMPAPGPDGALAADTPDARALQVRYMERGERVRDTCTHAARAHHAAALAELRPMHHSISAGRPAFDAQP